MRVDPVIYQDIHQTDLQQDMVDSLITEELADSSSDTQFEDAFQQDSFQQIVESMSINEESLQSETEDFEPDVMSSVDEASNNIDAVPLPIYLQPTVESQNDAGLTDHSTQSDTFYIEPNIETNKALRQDNLFNEMPLSGSAEHTDSLKQPAKFEEHQADHDYINTKPEMTERTAKPVNNIDYLESSALISKSPTADSFIQRSTVNSSATTYSPQHDQPALLITGNGQQSRVIAELPELGHLIVQIQHTEQGVSVTLTSDSKHIPLLSSHSDALQQLVADNLQQSVNPSNETAGQKSDSGGQNQDINFSFNSHSGQSQGNSGQSDRHQTSHAADALASDISLESAIDTPNGEEGNRKPLSGTRLIDFRV